MKKQLTFLNFLFLAAVFTFIGCNKEDDGPNAPELSISVTPLIADAQPGDTISFNIVVAGDLASVELNNSSIKDYSAQTFNDTIEHTYTFPESADSDMELNFTVVDKGGQSKDFPVMVGYLQPDYSLANFGVKLADTAAWSDWWEGTNLHGIPGATYDGGDASEAMYVTCRGNYANPEIWDFSAALPENMGTGLMMTRESIKNDDGTTAWDGYMIPVFGYYGEGMTQPDVQQLNSVEGGLRVIAIDVYYKTDPNSPRSFNDISIDNGGKGVKFQLRLGNHVKFVESGDKAGWFIIKEAFVAEPDTWTTLYFVQNDDAEINAENDAGEKILTMNGTASEVDFMWLVPAYSYEPSEYETHEIYLKNFRITYPPAE
ncbi:MAG: hypothetical protein ACOC3S_01115 [Bacteroidota bacterium]